MMRERIRAISVTILLVVLLLSAATLVCAAAADAGGDGTNKKGKKKVRMAMTGNAGSFLAGEVFNLADEDGMHVFDRSEKTNGLRKAEARVIMAYGDSKAQGVAAEVLDEVESDFFADVWVDFKDDDGTTTVTIRAGDKTKTLTFPTPDPFNDPELEARAQEVMGAVNELLGS